MLKKLKLKTKTVLRNVYADLLCPQKCLLCGAETNCGVSLCATCFQSEIIAPVYFQLNNGEKFCKNCGRFLISEKEYCAACRRRIVQIEKSKKKNGTKLKHIIPHGCDRIFTLYPYQGKCGKTLTHWKNFNMRGFAEIFAKAVFEFTDKKEELKNIKIVPVPPRPKKMRNKGWDQIEDMAIQLEYIYKLEIIRCLKRKDGNAQKNLSREKRKTNLEGKFFLKNLKTKLPDTLIILDDVMTTGATLHFCACALKAAGCKRIYGLSLFFD